MVAFGKIVLPAIAAVSVVLPGGVARSHLRAARASKLHPALTTGDQWLAHLKQEDLKGSLLNFENATLKHSNLGGLGPDKGPETLVISQAGAREGTTISMKFTVADGHTYTGKPENNGVSNGISTINVLNGASTSLNVELEDDKGNAVTLDRFFMTVFDIDAGSVAGDGTDPGKKAGVEEVEFTGINGYYMHPDAQILVTEKQDGFLGLVANLTGTEGDNPSSPWSLTKDQRRKTVMVEYINVSSFTMNLAIGRETGTNGRNFQLAGISDLISSPFGPCAVATYVDLSHATVSYDNLAGVEPTKQALVFSNAVPLLGSSVDLVISVFGGSYNPTAPSSNGIFGSLGQINMGPMDKVKFDFTFVKTGTSDPVALPHLFFSFYDIDQTSSGFERLTMISGGGMYFLSEATTLKVKAMPSGKVSFKSGEYGSAANNARVVRNADEDEAVTFYFKEPVSSFRIEYEAQSAHAGRNFQFGGMADAACA